MRSVACLGGISIASIFAIYLQLSAGRENAVEWYGQNMVRWVIYYIYSP